MHAHIFDIDGTLIDSNTVDGELYLKAVEMQLGQFTCRPDWADYTHVTDSGILAELLQDNGIEHTQQLEASIRNAFVALVAGHIEKHGAFKAIGGARSYLGSLMRAPGASVAYATGGWADSARLKLESAGFPTEGMVLCAADDHPGRAQIMRLALTRLGGTFDAVTYYGDAPWDKLNAGNLGWDFVGIGGRVGGIADYRSHRPR